MPVQTPVQIPARRRPHSRRSSESESPGARKLYIHRTGHASPRYVGYTTDGEDVVKLYNHNDREHYPIPKRELLGNEMWEATQAIRIAAEAAGLSQSELRSWLESDLPHLLRNLTVNDAGPDGRAPKHPASSGRTCPDQTETANADRGSGRRRAQ